MQEELLNKGIIKINLSDKVDQKTIVILGLSRSGTSMTARLVHSFGVFLGKKMNDIIFEDAEIRIAIEEEENPKMLRKLIEDRNKKHTYWGWKRPASIDYVDKFAGEVRNLHFIIPFRDHIAISSRASIAAGHDFMDYFYDIHFNQFKKLIDLIKKTTAPCFLFSYEKSIKYKENYISELYKFIYDKEIPPAQLQKSLKLIEPERKEYILSTYLGKNKASYSGFVDRIQNNRIIGWAKSNNSTNSVTIVVQDDKGKEVYKFKSNRKRKDLAEKFGGEGAFGFNIGIDQLSEKTKAKKLHFKIEGSNFELVNSPVKLNR